VTDLTGLLRRHVAVDGNRNVTQPTPSVGRNAAETVVAAALSLALSLPATIITTRYLHPAGRGAFYLGLVTVSIATTLFGSIGVAVTHEMSRQKAGRQQIVAVGLFTSLALGVIAAVILVPLNLILTPSTPSIALMPIVLPAILGTATLAATLVALGRIRTRNVLQLAVPAVTLLGLILLVVILARGVSGAVVAWIVAQVAVFGFAVGTTSGILRPLRPRTIPRDLVRSVVFLGVRAGVVNAIGLLNYRIDLFVLKAYRGIDAVGVYSAAVSLAELLWIIPAALVTAIVAPAVSQADRPALDVITLAVRSAVIVTGIAGVVLAALGPVAIPLLFGAQFHGAIAPLLILIPGVIAFAPAQIFAVYFSMRLGEMRVPLGVALASAVVTGLLAVLIIPPLGLTGAAIATTIGYALSVLIGAILFGRRAQVSLTVLIPKRRDALAFRSLVHEMFARQ
jgi:O-antigen/teichoic acid export membrane protein